VQLLGLLLALAGLVGFWMTRDAERTELGRQQRELLGVAENDVVASFVVAGRDILYGEGEAEPIYGEGGAIVGWNFDGYVSSRGINTDTILYVNVIGSDVTMVAIPRDLFVGSGTGRINGVLAREGPEGLVQRVEAILGLPIDYYAIIDLGIFQGLVDALGGVEVNVPERMYYRDVAGGLTIDFQPGPQLLDGQAASEFIRYRQFRRGDIDRLDNVKRLAYAMLAKLKQLNVRAVSVVPDLASTFFEQVETNASPALVRRMLPRLGDLEIRSATLPTLEVERDGAQGLIADAAEVQAFLADTFGGTARAFHEAPERTLLISDRSGQEGLGDWYLRRLVALGVPEERIVLREGSFEPSGTRVLATADAWTEADYYAELFGTGKQQVESLPPYGGRAVEMELVLGGDAFAMTPMGAAQARDARPLVPTPEPDTDAALPPEEP
jgi:LCP family protein required for cell wall assembly